MSRSLPQNTPDGEGHTDIFPTRQPLQTPTFFLGGGQITFSEPLSNEKNRTSRTRNAPLLLLALMVAA